VRKGEIYNIRWKNRTYRNQILTKCMNPRAIMVGVTFEFEVIGDISTSLNAKALAADDLAGFGSGNHVFLCTILFEDRTKFYKLTFKNIGFDTLEPMEA
jgi:hypothetical protein